MRKNALKITATAIALALCISSAGCMNFSVNSSSGSSKNESQSTKNQNSSNSDIPKIDVKSEYEDINLDYGYYALSNQAEKQLYKEFESVIGKVGNEKDDDGLYPIDIIELKDINLTESSIRIVIEAFNCDHPEIFWVSNTFGYYTDKDITVVHLYSVFSGDEIPAMQKKLNTSINEFMSDIPKGLSEYDREKFIHDKLLKNCSYSKNTDNSKDNPNAFTIYGALVENNAVCEGYTRTMQYLLKTVGIETISVNGYSKNELHQWCMVNIDDNWYHLDPTWNDKEDEDGQSIMYLYFNVTDSFIKSDHTIAKKYTNLTEDELCGKDDDKSAVLFNLPLPNCTSEENSYCNINGAKISDITNYDEYSNIVEKLYETASDKSDVFYLMVDENADFNKIADQLFYKDPYEFFEYTADVNNQLETDYKISDSLSVITYEEQKTIQVQLSYD
ncbi:MAG: transglutaminase domain-containing protein [Acutalibacteraceae bacterium]|nr:transglutaminase domain-containing protein [Acutalibacteraceae bacterium]